MSQNEIKAILPEFTDRYKKLKKEINKVINAKVFDPIALTKLNEELWSLGKEELTAISA